MVRRHLLALGRWGYLKIMRGKERRVRGWIDEFMASPMNWDPSDWFLAIALGMFATTVLALVAEQSWSTTQGAHGPIVLISGIWLLWRGIRQASWHPPHLRRALLPAALLALLFVIASLVSIAWLIWITAGAMLILTLYAFIGGATITLLWFPLLYLLMAVPPPGRFLAPLTQVLTSALSAFSIWLLDFFGFDVARSGVDLFIDQYELRMVDACAGLNSLFSLFAMGMFYIYLRHRADWRYAIVLALAVLPIAILANLARILILLLLTHWAGDAVAQGILHSTTGYVMFLVGLAAIFSVDLALAPFRRRWQR